LQEYQAGCNPTKADTDGDGMPDGWEVKHGLRAYNPSDAFGDLDRDGLTNLEEFKAGADPQNPDTDGDGLSDGMEVHETGTNPLETDITGIENVVQVNGADTVATLGQWRSLGTAIYGESIRGYVEYKLPVTKADVYRLEIEGRERFCRSSVRSQPLQVSIDGENLGRLDLTYGNGTNGLVHCFTPWLPAGEHRVRIFWDNVLAYNSLLLQAIRLQALQSADANQNGIKDWVENHLKSKNGMEVVGQKTAPFPIPSFVSPYCLEGRGGFLSMMQLAVGQVSSAEQPGSAAQKSVDSAKKSVLLAQVASESVVKPQPGAGNRWYMNVPLMADQPTAVSASFQNGGLKQTNHIIWQPLNLLEASDFLLRQGETLRMALIAPKPEGDGVRAEIEVVGVTNYVTKLKEDVFHCFDQPGQFTLRASYKGQNNETISRNISVSVVSAAFNGNPACWVGKPYLWNCPDLPPEAVVENDPRLQVEPVGLLPKGGRQFLLTVDAAESRYMTARLGANGPIMASARVDGFNLFSGNDVSLQLVERLPDGGQIAEMMMILSGIPSDIVIRLEIFVGGITFDDGTILKELTAKDFNALGQCAVRFISPATARTSVCHRTKVYRAGVLIGEF